jgi:hypothetical protein
MFDLLKVPVFGREEDAADAFLRVHRIAISQGGRSPSWPAYQYKMDLLDPQVTMGITKFSNVHGTPAQRFYNVLYRLCALTRSCLSDVVERKYLPEDRADGCEEEYEQVAFAFRTLISPHIDKAGKEGAALLGKRLDAPAPTVRQMTARRVPRRGAAERAHSLSTSGQEFAVVRPVPAPVPESQNSL